MPDGLQKSSPSSESQKKYKIALALIVKGTDEESVLLDRCLENVGPFVDQKFITVTHLSGEVPNQKVFDVAVKHGAEVSYFEWVKDFAKARNFNFSQVPKDYEYILWCDSDDMWRGLENLRGVIDQNPTVDAFAMWYLYEFDEHRHPIVTHAKTQVVRNDGCVEWAGEIHEDFKENRSLNVKFVDGIERMHFTNEERILESKDRNLEIALRQVKSNPNDPRSYFNLGNAHIAAGNAKQAKKEYLKFLKTSLSDDEKYIARQRLAVAEQALGNFENAIEQFLMCIGLEPTTPDAYFHLGYLLSDLQRYEQAEKYLMLGVVMKPRYHKMVVFNPRDYDYQPMMALAKVYFNKSRPDLALPWLKGCAEIFPDDEKVNSLVKEMTVESERLDGVIKVLDDLKTLTPEASIEKIKSLPLDLQSHPAIRRLYNTYVIKETSSGKDIAYYCGQTLHEWNPEMAKTKGIGGSEEAVINLAKEWTKQGYNVTVYNSCGLEPMECDGVHYKPWWYFNSKDKFDVTILWRHPGLADHELNTTKLFVDLHDVVSKGEFTAKRLSKIDKIFVKTKAHRILFPNIPDSKLAVIPNGMDFELFDQPVKKDQYLLVNTSSPDRSLDVLPKLFKKVKERVPEARCKWCYGWEIFDNANRNNKELMVWKDKVVKEMEEAGIENMGRLSQKDAAKLYLEGHVLAYPTEFYEIDCISVKKAQACGCVPVTTDFAALEESNVYGAKIRSKKTVENWSKPYQFSFGLEDENAQNEWVDAVVEELESPVINSDMKEWSKKFEWPKIASRWLEEIK